jgi:hypothetical protein
MVALEFISLAFESLKVKIVWELFRGSYWVQVGFS